MQTKSYLVLGPTKHLGGDILYTEYIQIWTQERLQVELELWESSAPGEYMARRGGDPGPIFEKKTSQNRRLSSPLQPRAFLSFPKMHQFLSHSRGLAFAVPTTWKSLCPNSSAWLILILFVNKIFYLVPIYVLNFWDHLYCFFPTFKPFF